MGEDYKALVAWEDTTCNKAEGSLALEDFSSLSLTLKMRWCNHLLAKGDDTWIMLAKAGISKSLDFGYKRKTKRH